MQHLQGDKAMLTKLLPDQISNFWDIIKYAVEQSVPPIVGEHPNKMNNILSACLNGSLDVWASYVRGEDSTKFEGIVLTELLHDKSSQTNNLLIYCLYGYEKVDSQSWIAGLEAILKYADSLNCNQVIAYTDVAYLIEMASRFGGDTRYTFVSFNVKRLLNNLTNLLGGLKNG